MRKCLGVLAVIASMCAMSWAQAQAPAQPPTQTPSTQTPAPDAAQNPPAAPAPAEPIPTTPPIVRAAGQLYPRIEWSAGYTFAQAGFFNAGHWAQLNGWYASFGLNAATWLGLVVDGGEVFGTSQIPKGTPAPFPPCQVACGPGTFNVDTREYNILFGLQFPYRKYRNWTPFGELMFGHDGIRGIATLVTPQQEVSSGLGLLAGGGVDKKINERFALRLKADYLQTRTDFRLIGKAKQDNLRVSVGLVIRSVKKKKRRLEDETEPEP